MIRHGLHTNHRGIIKQPQRLPNFEGNNIIIINGLRINLIDN